MSDPASTIPSEVPREAADLEGRLAASLAETSDELAHAEGFDAEQRAELYTILHTLMTDSEQHRQWLGQWIGREGETQDA